jgi:hypothetical protein
MEGRQVKTPTSAEQGWIYCLSNPAFEAYKIGASVHDPALRAKQLSASTSIPHPFTLVYSRRVQFPFTVEAAIHAALDDCRLNDSREFFSTPLRHIIELIEEYEELPDLKETVARDIDKDLHFSWLFASFPDDRSPRTLNEQEQGLCRDLERRLRTGEMIH